MSPPRLALIAVVGVFAAACGAPDRTPVASSVPVSAAAAPTASAETSDGVGASPSVGATASAAATPIGDPPALALEPIAEGIADPIGIATAPEGWLLVQEQDGRLLAVEPASGEVRVAADLSDRVLGEGERGLLGVALHPGWPEEPRGFVHYTDRDGNTVVAELAGEVVDGAPVLDPASERILLRVEQPYANHNGGQLAFGPDGYLWIGLGDGGSGGDPHGHGQDPSTLLGSILRIDVDDGEPYGIPRDNAFADDADGADGAPEVHVRGLRNPWRFSFDRATGDLWIADVGQNAFEEVNRLRPDEIAGANLGWNVMEASHCFSDPGCDRSGFIPPVAEYGRDAGCSVTGGHVVRAESVEGLAGWYVFGDYCSGSLLGVPSDLEPGGEVAAPRVLATTDAGITSFGVDSDGTLYLTDVEDGTLYRITAAD